LSCSGGVCAGCLPNGASCTQGGPACCSGVCSGGVCSTP
jgi:hypothetical protein